MKTKINSEPIDTAKPASSSIEAIFQDEKSSCTDILNNIGDGVYSLNANGYFTFVNKAILERSGMSREQFYRLHFLDLVIPENHDLTRQNFDRVMQGEDGIRYELTYKDANGRQRSVEVNTKPIREGEKVVGLLGISRDITGRKEAEEARKASEAQFRNFIENMPLGIFIYEGTQIRYLNPACEKITGYTRSELYLMDVWEIVHPEFKGAIQEYMIRRRQKEPVPELHAFKIINKNGEERWLERYAIAIEFQGNPAVFVAILDVTERKYAEEALKRSEEKYRALLENASDAIFLADEQGTLIEANKMAEMLLGYSREELLGQHYTTLHPIPEHERTMEAFKHIVAHGHGVLQDGQIVCKNGDVLHTDITASVIEHGGTKCIQGSFRDVSNRVFIHKALDKVIRERTAELSEKNIQLEKEIKEHMRSEALLKESTKKLNRYTAKLEEFNAALKVLLKERENERADLEEKILINIKYHFSPPLEKLKKRIQNPNDKALLEIVQSSVMNITSSFSQKLSSKDLHLTPSEIKIANMIKDGKTTKEIAESMGVSTNAINHHRYHIRKKLGIDSQKINLRAYLSSIKK